MVQGGLSQDDLVERDHWVCLGSSGSAAISVILGTSQLPRAVIASLLK